MNPTQICTACGRQRDCTVHIRSEHPPTAARRWLIGTCTVAGKPCVEHGGIQYRVGIA